MILDFSSNTKAQKSVSNNIEERSHPHPQLKTRFRALLNVVENAQNFMPNVAVTELR